MKVGQYPTPIGYETIDPSTNPFYSHSYIFNFGLPFKHTGVLAVTHVNDMLDIYTGIDTGTNTTFGPLGDNNGAIGGIGGFNLTLHGRQADHPGADAYRAGAGDARCCRRSVSTPTASGASTTTSLITYKATDALTLVTEANWVRDDLRQLRTSR